MIPVHDLAIGNWVYDGDKTKFPMYVQTIGEDYVYLNFEGNEGDVFESTPKELEGIPLVADTLEKAGFTYDNGYWRKRIDVHNHLEYYPHEHRLRKWYCGIDEWNNHSYEKDITFECRCYYLHEFQNAVNMAIRRQLKIEL